MASDNMNADQFKAYMKNPNEGPVVMLNLLKFKEGGEASYDRYMTEAEKPMAALGCKVVFLGKAKELLIGSETWDTVLLVQYPSRKAWLQYVSNPDFQELHKYWAEAVERFVLYAMDEVPNIFSM